MMSECVKCGWANAEGARICSDCAWPFSRAAWDETRCRIRRLTFDTGCINAKGKHPALNALERRAQKGLPEIQRSDAMLTELTGQDRVAKAQAMAEQPDLFTLDQSCRGGDDVLAGPDLSIELRETLFPSSRFGTLTKNQEHDVQHLSLHVRTGGDVFVTLNRNDFITKGRQETLMAMGVWVMEPQEVLELLEEQDLRASELEPENDDFKSGTFRAGDRLPP